MRNDTCKKTLVIGIIVLFIGMSITTSIGTRVVKKPTFPISNGKTLYVGGSGEGNYSKIQDALDNSSDGDTVFVYNGTYSENIRIEGKLLNFKTIKLIGQNKDSTIIEGNINISYAKETSLSGFTIRGGNSVYFHKILLFRSYKCTISNCRILNNHFQVNVVSIEFSYMCNINNNYISSTSGIQDMNNGCAGIVLASSHKNTVSDNFILNHHIGIFISSSKKNYILNNTILNNTHFGIKMWWGSCANRIGGNIIENNEDGGINIEGLLTPCSRNIFYKNIIANHTRDLTDAIDINYFACNNKFIANTIIDNWFGVYISDISFTFGNQFYFNNFIRNEKRHAQDSGDINLWYKPKGFFNGVGNYWDDYDGIDSDGDGIGDTPYENIAANNMIGRRDRFPFMKPVNVNDINVDKFVTRV